MCIIAIIGDLQNLSLILLLHGSMQKVRYLIGQVAIKCFTLLLCTYTAYKAYTTTLTHCEQNHIAIL